MNRLLIVDNDHFTPRPITSALKRSTKFEVVGLATNVDEALAQVEKCDTVLVSATLPNDGALELVRALNASGPRVTVLVMNLADTPGASVPYIDAGAFGWVL
jgi:DNA-binding NarL/FixJ family response regulator